jgi:hypothetical protein
MYEQDTSDRSKRHALAILATVGVLSVLVVVVNLGGSQESPGSEAAEEEQEEREQREAEKRQEQAEQREAEEQEEREQREAREQQEREQEEQDPPTMDERVEARLHDEIGHSGMFGGENEWEALRRVEVSNGVVNVDFDAGGFRRDDTNTMVDVYEALYTSDMDIDKVSVQIHAEFVNSETGEESEQVARTTSLTAQTAEDINWENSEMIEWERVFDTDTEHPGYGS